MQVYRPSTQGPYGSSSDITMGEAIIGFGSIFAFFLLLPSVGVAWTLLTSILSIPAHLTLDYLPDLLANVASGAVIGLIIGLIRYQARVKSEVVEELVGVAATRETVEAARLGFTSVSLHIVTGMITGLVISFLGVNSLFTGHASVVADASPIFAALAGGSGGSGGGAGGGGFPPGWDGLYLILGIFQAVLFLTCVGSVLVGLPVGGMAMTAVSGASGSLGKELGLAFILMATRLFTTRVTAEARAAKKMPPINLDDFLRKQQVDPLLLSRYWDWLRKKGYAPTPENFSEQFYHWENDLEDEGKGRSPKALRYVKQALDQELYLRKPYTRMTTTNKIKPYDGTRESLFHPGWFRRVLFTCLVSGAINGLLEAGLVSAALYFFQTGT